VQAIGTRSSQYEYARKAGVDPQECVFSHLGFVDFDTHCGEDL